MGHALQKELEIIKEIRARKDEEISVSEIDINRDLSRDLVLKGLKILEKRQKPSASIRNEAKIGQIWRTKALDELRQPGPFGPQSFIITVVDKEDGFTLIFGVPLNEDWHFATNNDLIVGPGEGMPPGLDYWQMIQIGEERQLPRSSLSRYLGEVSVGLFDKIQTILAWLDGVKVERKFIGEKMAIDQSDFSSGPVMEEWNFINPFKGDKYTLLLGQKVLAKDDPRLEYMKLVEEDLSYLQYQENDQNDLIPELLKKLAKIEEEIKLNRDEIRKIGEKFEIILKKMPDSSIKTVDNPKPLSVSPYLVEKFNSDLGEVGFKQLQIFMPSISSIH